MYRSDLFEQFSVMQKMLVTRWSSIDFLDENPLRVEFVVLW